MEDRENLPSEDREKQAEGEDVQGHSFAEGEERDANMEGDDVEGHSFAEGDKLEEGI